MSEPPTSTYRLQLTPSFGFEQAAGVAGHLDRLGVSHVYLSPILQAAPGSQHGYDVVDHTRISAELGGEEGFRAMVAAFREYGLGVVVDIVPNHMALPNPLADSVLEYGRESPYARFFDIDGERPVRPGWGEPNYRRFFDISGLIALRQEDPEVFEHTHALIFRLVAEGLVDGLRVDHPDGLTDPPGYLRRLAERVPDTWLVVEKILAAGEQLPADWPVAGTTGYDALRMVCGLFVNQAGEANLTDFYVRLTGGGAEFGPVETSSKQYVLEHGLKPELKRLMRFYEDPPTESLREALSALLVGMKVYRAYVEPRAQAEAIIGEAKKHAAGRLPQALHPLLDNVADAALGSGEFGVRFQQTASALAAKGVEDTAFYRWTRFAALNEVGGDPAAFGVSREEFHAYNTGTARDRPATMTSLGTHDTKRQEDVRARLAVLSELPMEWITAVRQWREDCLSPLERELEYLLWQTLVGAWPLTEERAVEYIGKAMREEKTRTSWTDQDPAYEEAVFSFVRTCFADKFILDSIKRFVDRLEPYARVNTLGQKLVQLTMPGVPDVYQGAELTDLALVDPDNRRPVDFDRRRELLEKLDAGQRPRTLDEEKLLVTSRALRLRRAHPGWFQDGCEPLAHSDEHLVAFRRHAAVTVATRLPHGLEQRGGWGDAVLTLGEAGWQDELTGTRHQGPDLLVREVLADLPVALLVHRP